MAIVLRNFKNENENENEFDEEQAENIIITSTENENIIDEDSFSVPDDEDMSKYEKYSKSIPITQLSSSAQSQSSLVIKELQEEVERLKKIIQIILNKQAELV